MAASRHRGSQGVPIVLLCAVVVFGVTLTWWLATSDRPTQGGLELLLLFLALSSGGTASVTGLQYFLRKPTVPGLEPASAPLVRPPSSLPIRPPAGSDSVHIQHVETVPVVRERASMPHDPGVNEMAGKGTGLKETGAKVPVDPGLRAVLRARAAMAAAAAAVVPAAPVPAPGLAEEETIADERELGRVVADAFHRVGGCVDLIEDPTPGTVEMRVAVRGRRGVLLCVGRETEVSAGLVRELVGTRSIEHADDAILLTLGPWTEGARGLATEQGIEWVSGREVSGWIRTRVDAAGDAAAGDPTLSGSRT